MWKITTIPTMEDGDYRVLDGKLFKIVSELPSILKESQ